MHLHDKAFFLALFFIIGIGAASVGVNVWLALIVVLAFTSSGLFFDRKYAIAFVLVTFLGFFYLNLYDVLHKENIPFGEEITVSGTIFREPESGLKSEQLDVKLNKPYMGEVRVYTDPWVNFNYGDKVEITGEIEKSPTGRLNIALSPDIKIIGSDTGGGIKASLFKLKESLVSNLNAVLPPQEAALMSGILFGERAEFTEEFKEAMKKSGTTHIVALSGYNVAIIGISLSAALGYFMSRRKAFYFSVLAVPAFVIMTGAQPSVVRAGIMGIIMLIAERQSRIYSFRNAVTLTALAMLIINPRLLAFDTGFQLSFAALLGIVYLYPFLKKHLKIPDEEGVLGWRRNLFQTLSAQLAVAPIILTSFGYFSPTALFANVLILEFVPLTMLFGFIASILGFVSFSLSLVIGWLTSILLGYEIFIINFFSLNWL